MRPSRPDGRARRMPVGMPAYRFDIPQFFDREGIYTDVRTGHAYTDEPDRYVLFQQAALQFIQELPNKPNIIHCHDHHTGLIPFMMQYSHKYIKLCNVASVITIHNGIYQGQFGFEKLNYLPQFDEKHIPILEWDNCINSLAVAVKCAAAVTTVSPNYMNEINNFCYGLEPLFNSVRYKSKGILNGIDIEVWNPVLTFYHKSPEARYISQSNWVGRMDLMTIADIIDKYGYLMTTEQLV